MMFCVTSVAPIGCTFLDWSIHFLSGQIDFFNVTQGVIPLSLNPLTKVNAHGHEKNHPFGIEQTQYFIEILKKQKKLTSFFPAKMGISQLAEHLSIDLYSMTSDQWKVMENHQVADYNQQLHNCHLNDVKIIFVSADESVLMYSNLNRLNIKDRICGFTERLDNIFFKDSINLWNGLSLKDSWDIREQKSLNIRPFNSPLIYNSVDLSVPHYWIDCQNWWYNGKIEIIKIMSWLGLTIDSDRFDKWVLMYNEWQQIQLDTLQFQYNYKHIVNCIIHNWSYDIDLTFEQEVIIQHILIYQHNLNLKTWQLTKFPNNTKDLHKLLEPNIHSNESIY